MAIPTTLPPARSANCLNEEELGGSPSRQELTRMALGARQVHVFFAVRAAPDAVRPWERMFVCGNDTQLGNWSPENALEMVKENAEEKQEDQEEASAQSSVWCAQICLDSEQCRHLLKFRYFVGYRLQTDPTAQSPLSLVVARWEANTLPRCILPSVEANAQGHCNKGVQNEFGTYGGHERMVMDGWLSGREQRQIFLRLFGTAFRFFDAKLAQRQFLVRCTPCDVRMELEYNFADARGPVTWRTPSLYMRSLDSLTEEGGDACNGLSSSSTAAPLPSHSCTEFANLLCDQQPFFREQSANGELFRNDGEDYFVFRTTSVATEFMAFRIELFMVPLRGRPVGNSKVGLAPHRFALAYCMPSSMPDTFGSLSLPLVAVKTQKPVGQIKIDYLLATPVQWECAQRAEIGHMEKSYAKHWKKRRTLEVGHRGSGESFTKFASARENTIFSLNHAAQKGADFVEFDVQLSRDGTVVIFHDFHVLVSVAKRHPHMLDPNGVVAPSHNKAHSEPTASVASLERSDMHQIAVRDLTLEQLRLLHVHHYKAMECAADARLQPLTGEPNEETELRPFPTLVDALERVDAHTGFNIEIKYPMRMKDGTHECENYFERNHYVDRVLADVFRHAGTRRIVFSSFDPDICTLLSVKQSRYPVLFLCVGETARYVPFLDERSNVSSIGTNFAACSNLLGVNLHSEELLSDPEPMRRALARKLVVFVWGEDLGNMEHVEFFRRQNVNGIIYDRVGELEQRQNVFVVEREVKNALFKSPRASPTFSRTDSLLPKEAVAHQSADTMANGRLFRQMTIDVGKS